LYRDDPALPRIVLSALHPVVTNYAHDSRDTQEE